MKQCKTTLGLILIILCTTLMGCKNRMERLEENLNNEVYSKAVKQACILSKEEDKIKAEELFKAKVDNIKNKFISEEIDGTLAIATIQKLKYKEDINDYINNSIDEINKLMNSRKAFKNGQRFESEGSYGDALDYYSSVIEEDIENFDTAKLKISEIRSILEAQNLINVEGTNIISTSSTHKSLYPDQMQLILKNESQKNIIDLDVTIVGFDANGSPIKIQGKNSDYKGYIFLGVADSVNIEPGCLWGDEYGWSLDENCTLASLSACVEKVTFSDESTWENPLYNLWLKEHWVEE